MHPSLENIILFDIGSLKEETVKDILTETRVLPDRISTPICPICGRETSANKDSSRKLGSVWICKNEYRFGCSGKQYMALHFCRRTRLSTMKSLDAKVQIFLEDISWGFSRIWKKKSLELKKIGIPTVVSEGISDKMPKTSNKKLLEALSDDDEVPFVDDVDGDPNWEDFYPSPSEKKGTLKDRDLEVES
ncbi:hypothetical protein NPIL_673611, partial [Nephila pilipes]